jgi:hypothetical protein
LQIRAAHRKQTALPNMSRRIVSIVGMVLGAFAMGSVIGWHCAKAFTPRGKNSHTATSASNPNAVAATIAETRKVPAPENEFANRLQKVLTTRNASKRSGTIGEIADGLSPQQIRGALESMEKIHVPERKDIMLRLLSRWGELEPEPAFAYARALKDPNYLMAIVEVTKSWAGVDLAAARGTIDKMPDSMIQKAAVAGIIEALSETDPRQAFDLAQKTTTYSNIIRTFFANWAEKNPEEAAAYALKLPPGFQRDAAIGESAHVWAKSDLQSALRWAESLSEKDAVGRMGSGSPLLTIFMTWVDDDSETAFRWLQEMPEGSQKSSVLTAIARDFRYQNHDLAFAERLIAQLPPGKLQDNARVEFVRSWSNSDLESAIAWAQKQSSEVQEVTFPALAGSLADRDPAAALKLVANLNEEKKDKAIKDVLDRWSNKDPAAAAAWVQQQPLKAVYLERVALRWVPKDLSGATQWVNSLSESLAKDQMLVRVVVNIQDQNPKVAVAWIEGISDEAKRNDAYRALARNWLRNDPAAAEAWLESAPLPEALKNDVLKRDAK